MNETIQGGKGDDKINVDPAQYYEDPATQTTLLAPALINGTGRGMNTGNVVFRGGDGDDEIWANTSNTHADGMTASKYYGGAGDDILKGALAAPTGQILVGQGGRDTIDTAWLDGIKTDPPTTYGIDQADLLIWGDYGYGTDGSFVVAEQYGDARLEE